MVETLLPSFLLLQFIDDLDVDWPHSCLHRPLEDKIRIDREVFLHDLHHVLVDSHNSPVDDVFLVDLSLESNETLHDVAAFTVEQFCVVLDGTE